MYLNRVVKCAFYVSGEALRRKTCFLNTLYILSLLEVRRKVSGLLEKTFSKCCDISFLGNHRMILRKNIFSWKGYVFHIIIFWQWAKFFDLLANLSGMHATNCILLVHANTLRRNIFLDRFVFLSFLDNERKFLTFWQSFPTWLSKLHFTCP